MILIRPGINPTHDDPKGGRRWHYLNIATKGKLFPFAYLYEHVAGGWGGEAEGRIFPDGYSPASCTATRAHIQERIEEMLLGAGHTITSAAVADVLAEREKQRAKWGDTGKTAAFNVAGFMIELPEGALHEHRARPLIDERPTRERLVEMAAYLIAAVERIDRLTTKENP